MAHRHRGIVTEQKPALPPALLRRIGEAFHGPEWQNRLARQLDISDRTVRRWAAGEMAVPPGVAAELYEMIREQQGELQDVAREVQPYLPEG
jgi:hypothetical protein